MGYARKRTTLGLAAAAATVIALTGCGGPAAETVAEGPADEYCETVTEYSATLGALATTSSAAWEGYPYEEVAPSQSTLQEMFETLGSLSGDEHEGEYMTLAGMVANDPDWALSFQEDTQWVSVQQSIQGDCSVTITADSAIVSDLAAAAEAAKAMTGIITISSTGDTGHTDSITLTSIDPQSGTVGATRNFLFPDDVAVDLAGSSAYFVRQSFSPDLSRVTAIRWHSADSATHAGWLDEFGVFHDATGAVAGAGSDFASAIKHISPRFGADGAFYFVDTQSAEVKRLTADQVQAVAAGETGLEATIVLTDTDEQILVWPSGTIAPCAACIPYVDNTTPGGNRGWGAKVSDWLDENTLLCENTDLTQISLWTPFGPGQEQRSGAWGCGQVDTRVDLLPETDRTNWNPVASPDGQTIAFLSSTGSGDSAPELFTIGRGGGEPVKVNTSHAFQRTSEGWLGTSNTLQIVDWR
jgi:hypothetical protein